MALTLSSELAYTGICRNDFDRSRHHVSKFFQHFVEEWAPIHPLATAARHKKLQLLQKVMLTAQNQQNQQPTMRPRRVLTLL